MIKSVRNIKDFSNGGVICEQVRVQKLKEDKEFGKANVVNKSINPLPNNRIVLDICRTSSCGSELISAHSHADIAHTQKRVRRIFLSFRYFYIWQFTFRSCDNWCLLMRVNTFVSGLLYLPEYYSLILQSNNYWNDTEDRIITNINHKVLV